MSRETVTKWNLLSFLLASGIGTKTFVSKPFGTTSIDWCGHVSNAVRFKLVVTAITACARFQISFVRGKQSLCNNSNFLL